MSLAVYVHDLNPVILPITDVLKIRWYGMAYFVAFLVCWQIAKFLVRKRLSVLTEEQLGDCGVYVMLLGVFLGGRLGYILFYLLPDQGFAPILADPLLVFKLWQGGMSSHGGILGLFFVTLWYARKHNLSWMGLGDMACLLGPFGVLCGRLANFINGELYGRAAEGAAWAVKFPAALFDPKLIGAEYTHQQAAINSARSISSDVASLHDLYLQNAIRFHEFREGFLAICRNDKTVEGVIEPYLLARHPSQIYEALLEGVALFAILMFLRFRFRLMPHGIISGVFFILYPIFRIIVEQFRESDSEMIGFLTKGQFYSVFMLLIGVALLIYVYIRERYIGNESFRTPRPPKRNKG